MSKLVRAAALPLFGIVAACATGVVVAPDDTGTPPPSYKDAGTVLPGVDASNPPPQPDASGPVPDSSVSSCGKVAPSNVCGLDPQCDCQSGTCEVDRVKLDGTTSCVAAGGAGVGKACTATTGQCAQGLTCFWGVCRPYCNSVGAGGTCSTPGTGFCRQLNDANAKAIPNLLVCSTDCTLTDAKSCGGTSGCVFDTANNVTECYPVGVAKTCSKAQPNCAPGLLCASNSNNVYSCLPWCKVVGGSCALGKTCVSLNPAVKVSGVEFGVCN